MTEYRWLLPAVLLGSGDERHSGPVRRSARDWFVDATMFVMACVMALFTVQQLDGDPRPLVITEQVIGAASCAGIWLRRRWPVGLALVLAPLTLFSLMVSGAVCVAMFTVAVHRPFKYVALVGGLLLSAIVPYALVRPDPDFKFLGTVIFGVVVYFALIAWGMFVRARRQLVLSLRDRAERSAQQARQLERERIAREMHDVLAHRLSLLSLHAGALEFRPDAPSEEIAKAASAIRSSAHQALEDLREVIGVLRHSAEGDAPEPPQPTLSDLGELAKESARAGMEIRLVVRVEEEAAVPEGLGRALYRIAQEGLTNARKHAPDAPVRVEVRGAAGEGLTVEVRNPARTASRHVPIPGSGTGLIGLAERASLAGGRLQHGVASDGDFRLQAWLPWPV
ncbi:histidine kinase [Streptosporangium soli]|nr:histidine kinase [Streptosporangium sp. KLBMP 9127]